MRTLKLQIVKCFPRTETPAGERWGGRQGGKLQSGEKAPGSEGGRQGQGKEEAERGGTPAGRAQGGNGEGRRLMGASRRVRAGLRRGLAAAESVTRFNF